MPEGVEGSTTRPAVSLGKTILDAIVGGRRKSDGVAGLTKTLTIIGVVVASCFTLVKMQIGASEKAMTTQMAAYDRLVQMVVSQNAANEERNRQALDRLEKSFGDLSETIRAAFYARQGVDAPKKRSTR